MQAIEKSKSSLQTIDGGMSRVDVRALAGAAAAQDADFEDAIRALGRVLDAFDAGLVLDRAPIVHGGGYDAGLFVPGVMPAGSPSMIGRRIRAFAPAIKARARELDVFIMSSHDAAHSDSAETLATAAAFARRFGRERLCVVAGEGDVASVAPFDNEAAICGMDIEARGVAEVCGALAAGSASFDALLVPRTVLETVSAVAAAMAGSASLVTECVSQEDSVVVSSGLAGESALPPFPGMVLAVSELLAVLGRVEAAARIADAWCRVVESGLHTADFEVTHPYARVVDDAEFGDALVACMGEAPRTLRRHFERLASPQGTSRAARPAMRVIQGGR